MVPLPRKLLLVLVVALIVTLFAVVTAGPV